MATGGERAFAKHLSRQSASEVRQEASSAFKLEELDSNLRTLETILHQAENNPLFSTSPNALMEPETPLDYEKYLVDNQASISNDPLKELLLFPEDDVKVTLVKRQFKTTEVPVPAAAKRCDDPLVKQCVTSFTADWNVVERRYGAFHGQDQRTLQRRFASLRRTPSGVKILPTQDYEVDMQEDTTDTASVGSVVSIGSAYDLDSSESDALFPELLVQTEEDRDMDESNRVARQEKRFSSLFSLCQLPDREDLIETRQPAPIPDEPEGLKVLIKVSDLKLEPLFEPIFAVLALYDAREKKKISESFHMDMNPGEIHHMLDDHIKERNISTLGRSAIFTITNPHKDIYLIVKLEKVLQKGDIAEAAEPYHREMDRKMEDRVKSNAAQVCRQLGQYRMPLAWAPVNIIEIISGNSGTGATAVSAPPEAPLEKRDSSTSIGDRRMSVPKKDPKGSLTGRTALTMSNEYAKEEALNISSSFAPVTLTVNAFFRQDSDKIHDDNLYRYLAELQKQPASLHRKLKSIPATFKLDISPPYDNMPCCLTSSLWQVKPYPEANRRPTKEVEEFVPRELFAPDTSYKNFLYVYVHSLDMKSQSKGQNLGVKLQFMAGEDAKVDGLQMIYGRSSGPRFLREYWCPVIYHNKTPEFYDEIKIELPPKLTDKHHLLFSFYHISCKKPKPEERQEPVYIGCTWVPLYPDGVPAVGHHELPVLVEAPPSHYSAVPAEGNNLPALKWMDSHKPLFRITITMESSVHPQDRCIMNFLRKYSDIQVAYDDGDVKGLMDAMQNLAYASSKALVKFLHIILDNLLNLVVWPTVTADGKVVSQKAFMAVAKTVHAVHSLGLSVDKHGRSIILASFIQHVMQAPVGSFGPTARDRRTTMLADARMVFEEEGEERRKKSNTMRGSSQAKLPSPESSAQGAQANKKLLHEEIAWAWVLNHQDVNNRKIILTNAWFLFDTMVKGMAQYLEASGKFVASRKERFPENFLRDLEILVEQLTQEISETHVRDGEYATNLNIYLAFFIHDSFSLLDRGFVFGLLKTYLKKLSLSQVDYNLTELKIQFLRIVCNHEHYVQLNLPLRPSLIPVMLEESTSPVGSLGSGLDEVGVSVMDAIAELSPDFRQHHYLSGLLLSELSVILDGKGNKIREPAIEMLRDLLAAHDNDIRYGTAAGRSRIATMYFPLLSIVMQHSGILFKDSTPASDSGGVFERSGESRRSVVIRDDEKFGEDGNGQSSFLGQNATHSLLLCFLWVLKNLEVELLRQWWSQLKISDINKLLGVLEVCVQTFEYKGRKAYMAALANSGVPTVNPALNVKQQLALAILGGQGTATQMLRERRKHMVAASQPKGADSASLKKRWCKSYYAQSSEQSDKPKVDANIDVFIESSLSAECSLVILDTVEELIQTVSTCDTLSSCLGGCLGVLLQLMNAIQSNEVYHHIFATQRAVVFKYPELLFEEEIEQCAELCACLLRHCGSKVPEIRSLACTSLYQLMKENFEMGTTGNNFARVKVQVTIALSSIVTSRLRYNEVFLRRSLKTLLEYAKMEEGERTDTFPDQVRLLAHNLNEILSNTMKLQQYEDDIETYMDLMYSIAKGYQNSPDLRLQWLQHMAEKHVQHKNYAEAAMCITHTVALVAEYLYILERKSYLPVGCVSFQHLSPNMLEESAISDDIISPEEEGLCSHKFFSEFGFMGLMEYAAQLFNEAKMYEAMSEVYKLVMPIHESRRAFDKLDKLHGKLQTGYQRILARGDKWLLGSFFRVGFYGSLFNDLDGQEFIYKEEGHTRLATFSLRLERQYMNRVGENNVVIIKDSNRVSPEKLDPTKAYIQITYAEPYFNDYEMSDRVTSYDKTVNVRRFSFRTPFTEAGKAHGSLENQFMRRTILTTKHHFPYVKTRVLVVAAEEEVLSPLECAIANMQDKSKSLQQALHQVPVDMKFLQMQLQGGIATSVNQGPYAIANTFLGNIHPSEQTHLHQKLKVCFKEFCKLCQDALIKNKTLISEEQFEYQKEMEKNFQEFVKSMEPMLKHRKKHHSNPRRHREGVRVLDKIARTSQGYSEEQ